MNVSPPPSLSATTRDVQCEKVPPLHVAVLFGVNLQKDLCYFYIVVYYNTSFNTNLRKILIGFFCLFFFAVAFPPLAGLAFFPNCEVLFSLITIIYKTVKKKILNRGRLIFADWMPTVKKKPNLQ